MAEKLKRILAESTSKCLLTTDTVKPLRGKTVVVCQQYSLCRENFHSLSMTAYIYLLIVKSEADGIWMILIVHISKYVLLAALDSHHKALKSLIRKYLK